MDKNPINEIDKVHERLMFGLALGTIITMIGSCVFSHNYEYNKVINTRAYNQINHTTIERTLR